MKPIDTKYRDNLFRSRLEARWAVLFSRLGVLYDYEPEGYDLGGGLAYLPDFWLPTQQCFIEIKAEAPNPLEIRKAELLSKQSGHWVDIVYGRPTRHKIHAFRWGEDRGTRFCFVLCPECSDLTISSFYPVYNDDYWGGYFGEPYYIGHCYKCGGNPNGAMTEYWKINDKLAKALIAAQRARFEFGTNG
jgi:hypothetical protein